MPAYGTVYMDVHTFSNSTVSTHKF